MMNNVEVKKRISGSVNPKDKYVMIEKLKEKNKNSQCFVLFSIVYHKSIKALVRNYRTSSSIKGKTVTHVLSKFSSWVWTKLCTSVSLHPVKKYRTFAKTICKL